MKIITQLDRKTFDEFVLAHPSSHYGKTSMWGAVKQRQENAKIIYAGLYHEEVLIATALLLEFKKWGVKYWYIPWGLCIDTANTTALQYFLVELKQLAQKQHIAFIRIDPNIRRDQNEHLTELFQKCGYQHKGYGYGYDGSWSNRYTLMIDLHQEESQILKNMTSTRRSAMKKLDVYCIETQIKTTQDIDILCLLETDLAINKGFKPHTPDFFKAIMEEFPDHHIYAVSTLNIEASIEKISQELASKKYQKDPEARAAKEKIIQDLNQLKSKYGMHVAIAAGLFLYDQHMSWDLYLYKRNDFQFINGTDAIHRFMINQMKERGVQLYDMCGFSGSTDVNDPYYGLYMYKSSFGSQIVEHLGEFNCIVDTKKSVRFEKYSRLFKKIKRRINYYRYKTK